MRRARWWRSTREFSARATGRRSPGTRSSAITIRVAGSEWQRDLYQSPGRVRTSGRLTGPAPSSQPSGVLDLPRVGLVSLDVVVNHAASGPRPQLDHGGAPAAGVLAGELVALHRGVAVEHAVDDPAQRAGALAVDDPDP